MIPSHLHPRRGPNAAAVLRRRTGRGALLGLLALALAAGCSTVRLDAPAPVEDRMAGRGSAAAGATAPGASASGVGGGAAGAGSLSESQVASVDLASPSGEAAAGSLDAQPPERRVVYFDFDSFVVKDEYRPVIEFGAGYLAASRERRILVEGHTDDRGGREYNLALGQKRADAVVRALQLLGVQESQVEAVSYGEERPAAAGTDEAAWARNRRAELKDRR
ncbi:MAG: peptidoglycan-associated lipoprotein Pal [Burkholderiaceae bacterium]|nr:peptidoglycan-associated lipoprotein Pal [Burkholderiaceae bacterium]